MGTVNSVLPLPQFKNIATKAADFWNPQNPTDSSLPLHLQNILESYTKGLLMVFSARVPALFKLFQNLVSLQKEVSPGLNLSPTLASVPTLVY